VVPREQANSTLLSQEPLTGHGGFNFPQVTSSVPPLAPRQLQLDTPPQEPATFADEVQVVQAY
jgi:hypothetical protein